MGSTERLVRLQIGTNNYLPDEDVRVFQLGALFQADVLTHVVQVVDEAVQQRNEGNSADTNHVLLHVVYPIAASCRQAKVGQENGQTPEVFPPERLGNLKFLNFQDKYIQTVQNVGGQFD